MDKTIYGQSKVMGFDPKVINLVKSFKNRTYLRVDPANHGRAGDFGGVLSQTIKKSKNMMAVLTSS